MNLSRILRRALTCGADREQRGLFRDTHGHAGVAVDLRPMVSMREPVRFRDHQWDRDVCASERAAGIYEDGRDSLAEMCRYLDDCNKGG